MKRLSSILQQIGDCVLFQREVLLTFFRTPFSYSLTAEQIWKVFVQSFPTTAMAGFFVGAILTVQFALQVRMFDALGYLGGLATSGTVREVGPLLIAFMLSGKVGAFTSAELGTMRVTEQIDAIRCLGANPLQEIVLPRFFGIIIASFFLLVFGLFCSIFGGLFLGWLFAGIAPEEYLRHIPTIVNLYSIGSGLFKCFCFALVLASICTFKGYTASGGAKGVGRAVVQTSMATMISIVLVDWLTSLISEVALTIYMGL